MTITSYLISGLLAYGLIGWLIGRAVHLPILTTAGMLIGLGISIGLDHLPVRPIDTRRGSGVSRRARNPRPTERAERPDENTNGRRQRCERS